MLIIASSVALYFIQPSASKYVYGAAILIGIGGSTMSVTALAMTADLIKNNIVSIGLWQVWVGGNAWQQK